MHANADDRSDARVDSASGLAYSLSGDGPAVILLHGLGGFRQLWRDQIERLSDGGFRAIAVDLPGHGDSPAVDDVSIAGFAESLRVLMDSLSIERAAIVGHSMGGRTMFQFALAYPERLWAIVPVGAQSESPEGEYRQTLKAVRDKTRDGGIGAFRKAFTEAGEIPVRTEHDVPYAAWFWDRFERNRVEAIVRALDAILAMKTLTPRLGEIGLPALCVVGAEDEPFLPFARRYVSLLPKCRVLVVKGCRHYPMIDAAPTFSAALMEFLLASVPREAAVRSSRGE